MPFKTTKRNLNSSSILPLNDQLHYYFPAIIGLQLTITQLTPITEYDQRVLSHRNHITSEHCSTVEL